ncbi:LysR family transcriptional regulator [Virgibacillus oceani]|uniref:LysR family transcriptional regulator n=1 Tax=Virgibacillus oceani TaxID=1479511 RepID=A0A917M5U1_9BACI|nr:LysR family transcriptional regulator [Virgibacillus oceani]GGG79786.1 LysR family transcriptional regulator [Virgibacillus oceani]
MELNQLLYFVTLVEQSTYTNAASVLHISQPSLSAAIKKLENEIGLTLIDRSTRKSNLTKEGSILYHEAKKLINHFNHVKGEMNRLKEHGPLELSIGLIESSKYWAPKVFKRFKEDYKDVRIKILDILSLEEVVSALSNFDIHLAITNQYINNEEIEVIPLYEERLVALLPPQHPLIQKNNITINELEHEDFIVCKEGYQTRSDILNAFRKSGIKPNIQIEIERFETACRMVEEGLGITVVPENYVRHSKDTNYYIRDIKNSNISRTVYLAFVKNRYYPPLVDRFIVLIQEFFGEG